MPASNTQFSIAIHLMVGLGYYRGCEEGVTSGVLAKSVNTSPSFVRRIVAKLSKAGLIKTRTGKTGSCGLGKDARKITLLEIYRAVDAPKAFVMHNYAVQKSCFVSCHVYESVEKMLNRAQKAFEQSLDDIYLAQVIDDIRKN